MLLFVETSISYCLLDYRYMIQGHCPVSPTFCSTTDTLVNTSVLFVLLFVGGRCQTFGSEMRKLFILKTLQLRYHMEHRSWCLVQVPEIYSVQKSSRLAMKRLEKHTITKKKDFYLCFLFILFLLASIIAKMIIKRQKLITITWNNQAAGEFTE